MNISTLSARIAAARPLAVRSSRLVAVMLLASSQLTSPMASHSAPMGHAKTKSAAKPAKIYRGVRGQIVTLQAAGRAGGRASAVVDHENIPNFMRAMRMTMPFQNAADARKFKTGDKIRFDMLLRKGTFLIANPRLLPASTRLKLAGATGHRNHSADSGR